MTTPSNVLTVKLPEELREKLDLLAEETKRSKSFIAIEALQSYLNLEAWQVSEIKQGIEELDRGEIADEKEVQQFFTKNMKGK